MLREFLRTLNVDCPTWARQLGLAREHAAIAARHERARAAWAPHLAASGETILAGAARCPTRRRGLIIGAGDCLDVPVAELVDQFDEVWLADVVVSPAARSLARRFRGRLRCVSWDATGALARLAGGRRTITPAAARLLFEQADPGPPPGGEPDLVVSANCLSQLGLVPGHSLPAAERDEKLPTPAQRRPPGATWTGWQSEAASGCSWLILRASTSLLTGASSSARICADASACGPRTEFGGGSSRRFRSGAWSSTGCTKLARGSTAPLPRWNQFNRIGAAGSCAVCTNVSVG